MKGTIHIVVLGKENVGKTAVAVRYLTGRYLTEYAHAPEMTYERNVNVDGKHIPLKITDISRKQIEQRSGNKEFLNKVDGILVVYAINDRHSFEFAEGICEWIRREKKPSAHVPVVLLGNKADLSHIRCVSCHRTEELKWRHDNYMITECSASTEVVEISHVFNTLINKILERRESSSRSPRRLSQNPLGSPKVIRASIKRRFSVFTRERTSTMCVSCHRTEELKWRHDKYMITECSASTEVVEISHVFNTLINKILERRESSSRSPRRLSQKPLGSPKVIRASIKRRFSVFTRERTSTM